MHVLWPPWPVGIIHFLPTGKVTCQGSASKLAVPQLKPKAVTFRAYPLFSSFSDGTQDLGTKKKYMAEKQTFSEHVLVARQCTLLSSSLV